MSNAKEKMDIYFDHRAPSIVVEIEDYKKGYIDIRRRGGKIRAFTEITKENVQHCKELMRLVDELRHLGGVKGGLAVSESEYMATTVLQQAQPLTQVIYSNVKEVVEQGQYIFDTLWNTAVPAEQRIREIEEGIMHRETRIIEEPDEIVREITRLITSSNELYTCTTPGGLLYSYNYFFEINKEIMEKFKKGEHKGIKFITSIDSDNVKLSKIFLDYGMEIRHVKNLPPMSFGVSDKEIAATIEKMENGKMVQSLLISNERDYITHFTSIFEELWKNGIDAKERIRDIEEGKHLASIEVIQNADTTAKLYVDIVKSAKNEILLIIPTTNAILRQEKIGAIPSLAEAAKERNVKVRLLTPSSPQSLSQSTIANLKGLDHVNVDIDIRYIEQMSDTKATILIVDRKESLVMELRDDLKASFNGAIGLSTYSTSKAGVLSYVAIFENLWKQAELYRHVKDANERLKVHDKMQKEFIDIAAHELRTPIQPILGLADILYSKINNNEQLEYLDIIIRNARRLQALTENILDVSKIESNSLILKKEQFDLNKAILHVITDYKNQIKNTDKIKVILISKGDFFVYADQMRITQVISNLLNNAIKSTKYDGSIYIKLEKEREKMANGDNDHIVVSIKDSGEGIHSDIKPYLFSKFTTKSDQGTGLGLFISKNIIKAHGGKIWAENNDIGEKGATFYFTLPLVT
jgi:two-component system sensor histidine kinase VicK